MELTFVVRPLAICISFLTCAFVTFAYVFFFNSIGSFRALARCQSEGQMCDIQVCTDARSEQGGAAWTQGTTKRFSYLPPGVALHTPQGLRGEPQRPAFLPPCHWEPDLRSEMTARC